MLGSYWDDGSENAGLNDNDNDLSTLPPSARSSIASSNGANHNTRPQPGRTTATFAPLALIPSNSRSQDEYTDDMEDMDDISRSQSGLLDEVDESGLLGEINESGLLHELNDGDTASIPGSLPVPVKLMEQLENSRKNRHLMYEMSRVIDAQHPISTRLSLWCYFASN